MTPLQFETSSFSEKLDHLSRSHQALLAELAAKQVELNYNAEALVRNQGLLGEKEGAVKVKQAELESRSDSLYQQGKYLTEAEVFYKDKLSLAKAKQIEQEVLAKELEEREKILLTKEESLRQVSNKQGLKAEELATREKALRADEESVDQLLNTLALQSGELATREKFIAAKEKFVKAALENQAVQSVELAAREKLLFAKEEALDVQAQGIVDHQNALEGEEKSIKEKSDAQGVQVKVLESRTMPPEDIEICVEPHEKACFDHDENLGQREKILAQPERKIGDSNGNSDSDDQIALGSPEEDMLDLLQSVEAFNEYDNQTPAVDLDQASDQIVENQTVLTSISKKPAVQETGSTPSSGLEVNDFVAARLPLFGPVSHSEEEELSHPIAILSTECDKLKLSSTAGDIIAAVAGELAELEGVAKNAQDSITQVSNEEEAIATRAQQVKSDEEEFCSSKSNDVPTPSTPVTTTNLPFCCAPALLGAVGNTVPSKQPTEEIDAGKDSLPNAEAEAPQTPPTEEAQTSPISPSENGAMVETMAPLPDVNEKQESSDTVSVLSGQSRTHTKSKKAQNGDKHARQKAKRAVPRVQAQLIKILQADESKGLSKEEVIEKLKSLADPTDLKKITRLYDVEKMVDAASESLEHGSYPTPPRSEGSRHVSGDSTGSSTINSKYQASSVKESPVQLPQKAENSWADELDEEEKIL